MSFFADVHDYCNSPSKKKEKVIAQQLQDSKVEINALGGLFNETPLAIVVKACCLYPNKPHLTKLLKRLLNAGADINARDGFRNDPILGFVVEGCCLYPNKPHLTKLLDQLIAAGANINMRWNHYNDTPVTYVVHKCCSHPNKPHLTKLLSQIIDAGADINAQGASGKTAIQEASKNNLVKIFFNNLVLRKQSKDNIEKYAKLFFEIDSPISFLGLDVVAIVAGYSGSLIHTPAEAAKIATKYLKN